MSYFFLQVSDSEQELEWIQLNLEIAQQDKKYKELQSCIEYFKNFNEERHDLTERQSELSSELHNVNSEMVRIELFYTEPFEDK